MRDTIACCLSRRGRCPIYEIISCEVAEAAGGMQRQGGLSISSGIALNTTKKKRSADEYSHRRDPDVAELDCLGLPLTDGSGESGVITYFLLRPGRRR